MIVAPLTVPPLYAIVDEPSLAPRNGLEALAETAQALAETGVGCVQLRLKNLTDREMYGVVEDAVRRLEGSATRLWIDDRADLALLFESLAGVHLGQSDLPPRAARRVLGEGVSIGRSTHDEAQLVEADEDPAVDLVAFGPIYATRSKERPDPVVGLEGLRRARRRTEKPLVAIGGIDRSNLAAVLEAGAESAAVIGALGQGSPREVAARARELLAVAEGGS